MIKTVFLNYRDRRAGVKPAVCAGIHDLDGGVRMPMTPERVLVALERARAGESST
jgi:hypothetical protein